MAEEKVLDFMESLQPALNQKLFVMELTTGTDKPGNAGGFTVGTLLEYYRQAEQAILDEIKRLQTAVPEEFETKKNEIIEALNSKAAEIQGIVDKAIELGLQDLVDKAQEIQAEIKVMQDNVQAMRDTVTASKNEAVSAANTTTKNLAEMKQLQEQMQGVASQVVTPVISADDEIYTLSFQIMDGGVVVTMKEPEVTDGNE